MTTDNQATKTIKNDAVANPSAEQTAEKYATWKPIVIGGVSGILMGAGALYAANAFASNHQTTEEADGTQALRVADSHDNLSFGDAFDEARNQVGAGGVFRWHGRLFNTYTREEWDAMSAGEKDAFAERVKPEIRPDDVNTNDMADHHKPANVHQTVAEDTDNPAEAVAESHETANYARDSYTHTVTETTVKSHETSGNSPRHHTQTSSHHTTNDDDVQLVSTGKVDMGNGYYADAAEYRMNGEDVVVIDVDNDDQWDIAYADLNHDNQISADEVFNLHTGETLAQYKAHQDDPLYTTSDEQTAETTDQGFQEADDVQDVDSSDYADTDGLETALI